MSFRVSNFLSIGQQQELTFVADDAYQSHDEQCVDFKGSKLLRCNVVFGPNGSGKSNLIFALKFAFEKMEMRYQEAEFHFEEKTAVRTWFELNHFNTDDVSKFEFEFTVGDSVETYGFEYNSVQKHIVSEYASIDEGGIKKSIFNRKYNEVLFPDKVLLLQDCFENRLLIGAARFDPNFPGAKDLYNIRILFSGSVLGSYDYENISPGTVLKEDVYLYDATCLDFIKKCLSELTDIDDIIIRTITDRRIIDECKDYLDKPIIFSRQGVLTCCTNTGIFAIKFHEKGFERIREFQELSSGIRRIISIILMLYSERRIIEKMRMMNIETFKHCYHTEPTFSINDGIHLLVIDEFGYSLHPKIANQLLMNILQKIQNDFTNIQILITAHNTELMTYDILRPDEVMFTEFNDQTEIYSLSDFDYIRNKGDEWNEQSTLNKFYLEGRFGAVPKFSNQ